MGDSTRQYEPVLYGRDTTAEVVGVDLEGTRHVRLFSRTPSSLTSKTVPFEPFLWLTSEDRLAGWRGQCRMEPLSGTNRFRRLARFPDVQSLESAASWLQRRSGRSLGAPGVPYLYVRGVVRQYFLWSGTTQFLGMGFQRLLRMQIDLEVYRTSGFEFPNPLREGDRITAIAMSDSSGWERLISGREYAEAEMLAEMVGEIRSRDPDVIEGHNIFRFDLPYLEARARRHRVELAMGRDGSAIRHRQARFHIGERDIPFRNYEIHGRHVIDTWFLAQRFSRANPELKRNGLKDVARHFGVAAPQRTYIPGAEASWYFDNDPDTLFRYALDDVRETRAISAALSPAYYVQARIFPCRYQDAALVDDPAKIDGLMLREYLARGHSVPEPAPAETTARKHAEVRVRGVSRPVVRCDVTALYPAVMLAGVGRPSADELGVFPELLRGLRDLCKAHGQTHGTAPADDGGRFAATVRSGFKVLLEGFHDYLAFAAGHFNDARAADQVTEAGGELVRGVAARLDELGHRVVTVDAGGVYFVSRDGRPGVEEALAEVSSSLPWNAELPLRWHRAIFCHGPGNYALLDEQGDISVAGAELSSRGLERYRREWLQEALGLLFADRKGEIPTLYDRYRDDIASHRLELSRLKRTETLRESLDDYQMRVKGGKQHPRGAYEVALSSERNYLPGDQISYYVGGEGANVMVNENCRNVSEWDPVRPDENADYYKARLRELYEKFSALIAQE